MAMKRLLATLVIIALFAGCSAASSTSSTEQNTAPDHQEHEPSPAPAAQDDEDEEDEKSDEGDDDHQLNGEHDPYQEGGFGADPDDRAYDVAELYDQVCADCHGEQGDGDGQLEDGFSFATAAEDWTNEPSVDGILKTLEDGIHETAMREFPEYKDVDRIQLAHYILDLRYALGAPAPDAE